jgi:tRNA (cmo5U34)-methyltransferase
VEDLTSASSQFHFDPATYMELMAAEVPLYATLQETIATTAAAVSALSVLDLGTGTGETLTRVLARHPEAQAIGVDESDGMLELARGRLADREVDLRVADLRDPLPEGPFDLVVSALAIHHLDGPGKAELFGRIATVLRPGGRFVLGDVVIPEDADLAVTPLSVDYDKPSRLSDQIAWLEAAGFTVAVIWQGDDLAVVCAELVAA